MPRLSLPLLCFGIILVQLEGRFITKARSKKYDCSVEKYSRGKCITNKWQIGGRRKWQTGGREKCLFAAEPIKFLKVWLIRIPRFCVDDSNSVPNLPLPMKNIGKKTPGSSIHKLYDLRSPNSQPSELGNLTSTYPITCLLYTSPSPRD